MTLNKIDIFNWFCLLLIDLVTDEWKCFPVPEQKYPAPQFIIQNKVSKLVLQDGWQH